MDIEQLRWDSLIDEYRVGRTEAYALDSPHKISTLPLPEDFQRFYFDWKCDYIVNKFLKHETRAFLIVTPKSKSFVLMSWLGRRSSRWHVCKHIGLGIEKPTRVQVRFANNLAESYQEAWDDSGLWELYE